MGLFSRKKSRGTDDPTLDDAASGSSEPIALEAFDRLIDREWERLATAGTWWTGGERIAIAADARRFAAGETPSGMLPPPVEAATRLVASDAAAIRQANIASWEADGLDPFGFVEITGVVSRILAIDVTTFGLGRSLRPLPESRPGHPSRERPEGAQTTTGWAPTVGPATAMSSLSAVPAEAHAMFDLHEVLYTSIEDVYELGLERDGLTRPQIELVAARTCGLHGCLVGLLGHTSLLRTCSSAVDRTVAPRPLVGGVGDTGVEHGAALIGFVDAVVLRDPDEYPEARRLLEEKIGAAAANRAAMIAGHFSMMSRVLCAVRTPVEGDAESLASELGVSVPAHLRAD